MDIRTKIKNLMTCEDPPHWVGLNNSLNTEIVGFYKSDLQNKTIEDLLSERVLNKKLKNERYRVLDMKKCAFLEF